MTERIPLGIKASSKAPLMRLTPTTCWRLQMPMTLGHRAGKEAEVGVAEMSLLLGLVLPLLRS